MEKSLTCETIRGLNPGYNYKIAMACIGGFGFLSILTCLLINFIIDGTFTWSLIVFAGVLFIEGNCLLVFKARSNLAKKIMIYNTIAIFPLLAAIQAAVLLLAPDSGVWLVRIGYTITGIWIITFWLTYFIHKGLKCNHFITAAVFFFVMIPATIMTNFIGKAGTDSLGFLISTAANAASALLLGVIAMTLGFRYNKKRREG